MYIYRYIEREISEDLDKKMVFISGPRQSGKTTLSRQIAGKNINTISQAYFNWDAGSDREKIIKEEFPIGKGVIILDEIHKYSRWRQVVKGLFDKRKDELKIIVTGSGKLDHYRYGGDSLQGRYHFYRLHPLTLAEVPDCQQESLMELYDYGGFPEVFLLKSRRESNRWSKEYRSRIINDDISSLENVKDLALLENLSYRLPYLVGSPLSVNSLKTDLQVSHQTVSRWLGIFENNYMIFRLYPFGSPKIRAVKKEAKHYHYDWNLIEDDGIRFENMVACHLLKWCHYLQNYNGEEIELRYFRDIDKREVDFVILNKDRPVYFIECKLKNKKINSALKYLKERFPETRAIQISLFEDKEYITKHGIEIMNAYTFLKSLK